MARWKLTEPHYLNCPDERWEHTVTDVKTGKPTRKMYKVPRHLDPRIAEDWNVHINGMDGEIHVCWPGKGQGSDIVFEGNPTPGMYPLDDEAREVSGRFDWTPTQGIDEESQRASFYSKLTDKLVNQLTDMKADAALAPQAKGFDDFMKVMLKMMEQNQQTLSLLAQKGTIAAVAEEPVVDDEPPLTFVEPTETELAEAEAAMLAKETKPKVPGHIRRI